MSQTLICINVIACTAVRCAKTQCAGTRARAIARRRVRWRLLRAKERRPHNDGITNMRRFMRFFFHLLYHPFAFTYDLVAWVVSFGKWNDWVLSIVPHLEGTRLLELGHGPGHLQRFLRRRGLSPVAIDESTQMGNLARCRLGVGHKLTRGLAQALPFSADSFDTVVSTFPSEYIFDPQTLSEVKRVLSSRGRLIVLPAAFPSNGFLKWVYKVTGESPASLDEALKERLKQPFVKAGFEVEVQVRELQTSTLVVLIATK